MPTVPVSQGPRANLAGGPGAQFTTPQVAVPDAQLSAPQLSTALFHTPQLRADQMRPVEGDPSAIRRIQVSNRGAPELEQMGANLGAAGQALSRTALEMQLKVNATTVDDALNDARVAAMRLRYGHKDEATGSIVGGYVNLKGDQAFRRPAGPDGKSIGLDDEVGAQFKEQLNSIIAAKLTNPVQRQAFEAQANDLDAQLRQGAMVHQAEQFNTYTQAVYTEGLKNQTAAFGMLDPGDREGQAKALDSLDRTVGTMAVNNGASPAELDAGLRMARTNAVTSLFEQTLSQKKYTTASAILKEYGDKIDPNSAAKMRSALDGHVGIQMGEQIADNLWDHWAAPAVGAGDADRGYNIALGLESHGRQVGDDGKVMWSKDPDTGKPLAGGIGQLTPDTAKRVAKEMGHPEYADYAFEASKRGEAANRLISRRYWDDLVGQFGGDTVKAAAAYNAGPGWLVGGKDRHGKPIEGALKQAARTGQDWRTFLPKETQDYVTNFTKAYGAGDGKPARPSKEDLYAKVDAMSDDPDVRTAARAKLDRRFAAADYDESKGKDDAYAEGIRVVRESGGNINAIPPELKAKIDPKDFTTLGSYAKNVTDGAYNSTDNSYYYTGTSLAMDPRTSASQIEALRPHLSEQDFGTVQKIWMDHKAPEPGKGPDSLDVSTVDSIVNTRLQYMGIDVKPKKGDTEAQARLGAINQFVHQYVLDRQRQTGKKFVDYADLEGVVNEMFLKNQSFKQLTLGGMYHGKQNVLTSEVRDIPSDTRAAIKTQLKKGLGRDPSDAETLQAYFRSQFYKGG